ncbi:MAG TPA: 5-dehydro-4-deoxy-D-glucuronate isomerase [Luteolibacter sp.]|nr:5-dehydro-4-deoxy-D-glucuronate isomerase [Luteolibacter sp.]
MTFDSEIRRMPRPQEVARMTTAELRDAFLAQGLFQAGQLRGLFTDLDRMVIAGAMPSNTAIALENHPQTGRESFLERRELGAINTGGAGRVTVDGVSHEIPPLGCIYVGMGAKEVRFESSSASQPAKFFILSCPAHRSFPTATATRDQATTVALGSPETSNQRVIRQYIHENGIQSCQLVMGFTELGVGSVWNTFPPHTHFRRCEVYHYFDMEERVLAHFMGEPQATRHLFVRSDDTVLSPSWSIHSGCGQGNYKFIWGMAGENQRFTDMDAVAPQDLR